MSLIGFQDIRPSLHGSSISKYRFNYGRQKMSAFGNFLYDFRSDSAYHHFLQSTVSLVGEPF